MRLSGGEIIARSLKEYGVTHVAGIPGHGNWALADAFNQKGSDLPVIQVMHEQSAVHMADGFARASGRPMAALTSTGPGSMNTPIGLATAMADSIPLFHIKGSPLSYMRGTSVMQQLEMKNEDAFSRMLSEITKKNFKPFSVEENPSMMHRAIKAMVTGRPGPVTIDVPMDIQAKSAEVEIHDMKKRMPTGLIFPDPKDIDAAVEMLISAKRPAIVAGGGVMTANASKALCELAEKIGAVVCYTFNGKGAISDDHPLCAGGNGQTGTTAANSLLAKADVLLSVGCRFTDWSSGSYAKGSTYSIPPSHLIHIDIDAHEIGKTYPTEIGIVSDAKAALEAMVSSISKQQSANCLENRTAYHEEIAKAKNDWLAMLAPRWNDESTPFTFQYPYKVLREVMDRNCILAVGSGNTQGAVKQSFPIYEPRTHLTSGGYSPMGWAVPAALGAKLAKPDQQVCAIMGDGDFMMSCAELGVAAMNNIPIVIVVQNNSGYMSIRGGQRKFLGRATASEFSYHHKGNEEPYSANISELARTFHVPSWKVSETEQLKPAFEAAFSSGGPALVEVITSRDAAGPFVPGWWDLPSPDYYDAEYAEYQPMREKEQHF